MIKIDVGNTKGIDRKIDDLGRVTIPREFLKRLKINNRNYIEIFLTKEGIFMKEKGE